MSRMVIAPTNNPICDLTRLATKNPNVTDRLLSPPFMGFSADFRISACGRMSANKVLEARVGIEPA
jgi:hypothetical protein